MKLLFPLLALIAAASACDEAACSAAGTRMGTICGSLSQCTDECEEAAETFVEDCAACCEQDGDEKNANDLIPDDCGIEFVCASSLAGVIVAVVGVVGALVGILLWWAVRGRFWWTSTSHKRFCCHPNSSCKGCGCGCHPYEAVPPPRYNGQGRKRNAVRVSPCFPQNPLACGGEPDPAHPPGCGCACACKWCPPCCFRWPRFCVKACCEDEMPSATTTLKEKAQGAMDNMKQKVGLKKEEPAPQTGAPQQQSMDQPAPPDSQI